LHLAFTAAGMARKDVKDKLRAVNHARIDFVLDIPLLRGGEFVVNQNQVGICGGRGAGNLLQFAFADQRCGIRTVAPLHKLANDLGAGGDSQFAVLAERFFNVKSRVVFAGSFFGDTATGDEGLRRKGNIFV